jgi:hypothetical protein
MLRDILDEITKNHMTITHPPTAIVFVREERTCLELQEYLTRGSRQSLKCQFKRYLQRKKILAVSPKTTTAFGSRIRGRVTTLRTAKGYNRQRHSLDTSTNEETTNTQADSTNLSSVQNINKFLDLVDQQTQELPVMSSIAAEDTCENSVVSSSDAKMNRQNQSEDSNSTYNDDNQVAFSGDEYDHFFGLISTPFILLHSVHKRKGITAILEQVRWQTLSFY